MILGPAGPGSAAATCRGYRPFLYKKDEMLRGIVWFMEMMDAVIFVLCYQMSLICFLCGSTNVYPPPNDTV